MVTLYPHILKAKTMTGGGLDDNGNVILSMPTISEFKCRYRPNIRARQVNTIDGQTVIYKGTIYLPLSNFEFKTGDTITVEGFIEDVEILQVYKAQMRTRIIC